MDKPGHTYCPRGHSLAAPPGSARNAALKATVTMGILDRAILCGLGLSADSANIVMLHIEELRDEIKRLKRNSPNAPAH